MFIHILKEDTHIRRLGPDDYEELINLWQRTGLHSLRPHGRDSRTAIAQQMTSGVQTILGLEIGHQLVGAVIATHDSRKGWINRLVVDPDHRRQGYALRLVEEAEKVLHDQGIRVVAALVEGGNAASLALFEKVGYTEVDADVHYLSKRDSDDA